MFGMFKKVTLEQGPKITKIEGVNFLRLGYDIERHYGSSVVTKYMFRKGGSSALVLDNFFLLELHIVLKELLKNRNLYSDRKVLSEVITLLEEKSWIRSTVNPSGSTLDVGKVSKTFKLNPFESQKTFLLSYLRIKTSYCLNGLLLDAKAGSGKAQVLSAKIKVPGGWSTMGEMKVGSKVIARDGHIATVTEVHPQGITDVYRVHFSDGRFTDVNPEHLWTLTDGTTHNTEWIKEKLVGVRNKHSTLFVPLCEAEDGEEVELPATPYHIGKNYSNKLALGERCAVSANRNQRLSMLTGMMDQNGYVINNDVIYTSSSMTDVNMVQYLVRSLGGIATRVMTTGSSIRLWIGYRVPSDLFTLPAKKEKAEHIKAFSLPGLEITRVEERQPEETQCISIDHPEHLYVTDDFIVTHNTFTSLVWSELLNKGKTIVVCPSSVIYKVWVNDIRDKYFKQGRKCWVFQEGKPLDTTADYFIFHNDCLRNGNWEYIQQLISNIKQASHKQQIKLIVDECHNFNETSSQQCQILIKLCDYAKFTDILFMSGTPLKAIGKEAYTLFCCIDPWFTGNARDRFLDAYGRSREKLNGLLANRLGRNRFVIESLDGMPEEPEIEKILVKFPGCEKYTLKALRMDMITYTTERVKFYEKHMDDYIIMFTNFIDDYERSLKGNAKAMAELTQYKKTVNYFRTHGYNSFVDNDKSKFCKEVEVKIEARLKGDDLKNFRNIKSAVKYVGLKIKGEVLGRVIGGARSQATYDLFMHANLPQLMQRAEKKTLIYTSYVDVVKGCAEYMTKLGYKPTYVFGENSKDRDRLIQEFGAKKEIDPLITTFDSLKEGYPLIMANLLIMLNAPFRDYEVKQTKARIFRTGQDSPCFFLLLELDTGDEVNISSRSINILEWSKDQVEQLLSQSSFSNGEILNVGGLESYDAIDDYDHGDVLWPKRSSTVLDLF